MLEIAHNSLLAQLVIKFVHVFNLLPLEMRVYKKIHSLIVYIRAGNICILQEHGKIGFNSGNLQQNQGKQLCEYRFPSGQALTVFEYSVEI